MERDFFLTRGSGLWDAGSARAAGAERALAAARDAVARSFLNRLGRLPTEEEFSQSIGYFLPEGVAERATKGGAPTQASDTDVSAGFGVPSHGTTLRPVAVARADAIDPPMTVDLEPGACNELFCRFDRGRYEGWAQMVVRDTPAANFRRNTTDTRPASLPRPPIIVDIKGEFVAAGRSRAFGLRLMADDRMGQAINHGLGIGALEGPGHIRVDASNRGPFAVDATLGVRPGR